MSEQQQHDIPAETWATVGEWEITTTGNAVHGVYMEWMGVSEPIPVPAGAVIEWTPTRWADPGGNMGPFHAFLSIGADLDIPPTGTEPVAAGDTVILDYGTAPVTLTATATVAGDLYAGAWFNDWGGGRCIPGSVTITAPLIVPEAALAGSVITVINATAGDEYIVSAGDLAEIITIGPDGSGAWDTAEWNLQPGSHTIEITGPGIDESFTLNIPDPEQDLIDDLAPRVAAFIGRPGDTDVIAVAEGQLAIVAEFVRGYTRGRGWTDEGPGRDLRAVIVSAASRLALNPEQVRQYSAADYSETPALLLGFNLAERAILDRHRRRWA